MALLAGLLDVAESVHPLELGNFRKNIPAEWVQQALEATGTASVRKRRLPADQVLWLVIGMGMYRNQCIEDVVGRLELVLDPIRGRCREAPSLRPSETPEQRLPPLVATRQRRAYVGHANGMPPQLPNAALVPARSLTLRGSVCRTGRLN